MWRDHLRNMRTRPSCQVSRTLAFLHRSGRALAASQPTARCNSVIHGSIGMATKDALLGPIYRLAFRNPLTAPIVFGSLFFLLRHFAVNLLGLACAVLALTPAALHFIRRASARPIYSWKDEIVLITGGSHGVGDHLVNELATKYRPRHIVVLDIKPTQCSNKLVCFFHCDVSKPAEVEHAAKTIINEIGHPTILVNNAGIVHVSQIVANDASRTKRIFQVNVLGCMWILKAFLPGMIERNHGCIVTMASVIGHSGVAHGTAVISVHESLRQELVNTNIKAICVHPGLIETGMFTGVSHQWKWLTPALKTEQVVHAVIAAIRGGQNQDIYLPLYTHAVPLLRFLPIELADWVREWTGANQDLRSFEHSVSSL
ncbi:hypothetical protein BC832DRAFT_285045 [Gaertneriomyces semiglobifer]|nr:hypothetical protein BC832DRAFT_285045 [Gaertneriomyces semiglobifer]